MNATSIYNGLKSIATSVYSRFTRSRVVAVVDTGIYSRMIVESDGSCVTPEERPQLLQEEADIDQNGLEEVRAFARRVLTDHGIAADPPGFPVFGDHDDVPEIVRDASELLCRLNGLRGGIETRRAFQAGVFYERMKVRQFEPLAAIGRKCVDMGREGGSGEKLTDDERRERIARADKAIADYKKRHGNDCKVNMMWDRISVSLGFSKKTYTRYLKAVREADKQSGDTPR